ncbi:MAG: Serine acetyltransferase [Paracidovorax wautersii]|uniref:Serine acetyltransferase n=1 Tax=Paracidovorax wautersii TaxID=1177982 RepID=A0A7V8JRN4_9BURK|nr:MAG: Serine acetyltransferase [Paracidovorax wautersii]
MNDNEATGGESADSSQEDHEPAGWNLPAIVAALRDSRERAHKIRHLGRVRELPSREAMTQVLEGCLAALFPTHYGRADLTDGSIDFFVGRVLHDTLSTLQEQVRRSLYFVPGQALDDERALRERASAATAVFASRLPGIRALVVSDLQAAYQGDPAATSISEILLCYPGVLAVICHRLAHELYRLDASFLARLLSDIAHARTGIDIHPGARIGPSFFIDHGTGVVIGQTAVIGERVRLYQHVTLGARRFEAEEDGSLVKGQDRHPVLEDDVVIYAGATVLGRIVIGRGSTIGGNVWLTHSVPPGSNISQARSVSHGPA